MVRKTLIRLVIFITTLTLGLGVLGFLLYREGPSTVLEHLMIFGILPFVGFVVISALNFILYSLRWQIIINSHLSKSKHVPLHRVYMHRMAGYAVSYLTPAAQIGGEPVRVVMLGTEDISLKKSTSAVVLDIAFEISAYVVFIIAGVALALIQGLGEGANSFLLIFIGLAVALCVLFAFFGAMASGKGFFAHLFRFFQLHRITFFKKFEKNIIETEALMAAFLGGKPLRIIIVALLSLIVIAFRVVEAFYIALFLGVNLSFAQAFLVSTLPGIALILPVPGGLGLFEGGFTAVFALLGIPLSGVAFALIIRLRDAVFIFAGVVHILRKGQKFIKRKLVKPALK